MMMQRMSGLFCAVLIASLISRYMSCVIAFFFSGRRSVITRVASSSVTVRCPVMMQFLEHAARMAWLIAKRTLHHLTGSSQTGGPVCGATE